MSDTTTMEQPLLPVPRVWLRAVLLAVVLTPLVIANAGWEIKIPAALLWTAMIGTYRDARLEGPIFQHRFVVCFVPLKPKRLKLERVVRLGIDTEESVGIGWVFVFGVFNVLLFWLFDWLFPWLGGRYRVWLVTAKGRKTLAWQGNSDTAFEQNLQTLQTATGCQPERTGFTP